MDRKFQNSCPCKGCKDRCGDPNCHSERCPHGYLEWKARVKAHQDAAIEGTAGDKMVDEYNIRRAKNLKRRYK